MIRGIYAAASGMVANFKRQLITTNNLTNVSTPGYKQDVSSASEFANFLVVKDPATAYMPGSAYDFVGPSGSGTELDMVQLDLSQGSLRETGNPLDLAISGPGFFAIQTETGTVYTRDGTFMQDAQGYLCRADGAFVLSEINTPLQLPPGEVSVAGDGTVTVGDQTIGRIKLVDFAPGEVLVKVGNNCLVPENAGAQELPAQGAAVSQGFLEHSNVDIAKATVDMLSALRSYEASQRLLQLQDQTLAVAVNEVAKV